MSKTGDAVRLSAPRLDGISLEALIGASRRLDELSTARVIGEAADVVHKAQQGGRALGTLAPMAIWIGATGSVTVEPASTSCGYTAPERLRGSQGDRRSDVFTLGVLLWEALAHERLFDGPSDSVVKAAVLAAHARPPSECNANVPAELDAICKKALALDPVDRYQSAKVMAAEISAVLDDAGYPETNDEIARYVAAALSMQTEIGVPLPSQDEKTEAMIGTPQFVDVPAPVPIPVKTPLPAVAVAPLTATPRPKSPTPGPAPAPAPAQIPAAAAAASPTPRPAAAAKPASLTPRAASPTPAPPPAIAALAQVPVSATGTLIGRAVSSDALKLPNDRRAAPLPRVVVPPKADVPSETRTPSRPLEAALAPAVLNTPEEAAALAKVQWHDASPSHASAAATLAPGETLTPPSVTIIEHASAEIASAGAPSAVASGEIGGPKSEPREAPPAPAAPVVALPPKADPLGGWGWGTGAQEVIDDDYDDGSRKTRKRLVFAIGGALGVILLVVIVALAAGGSRRKDIEPQAPSDVAGRAWAAPPPKASEPATPPPVVTPAPSTEPDAAKVTAEPPKTELPKAPPAEAAKVKAEPPKAEPPKAEPPKAEPPKVAAAKPAPEPAKTKPAAPAKPPTVAARAPSKPLDPYGEPKKADKIDANAAYKTGLQQFARGDSQAALATFKASLASNPDFAPTWRGIGLVYEKLGERSRAKTAFQRYLKLAPSAGDASQIRERLDRL